MTIILFLVDTSASMAQKNYMGVTALDTAKSIVQDIIKLRQRDINARQSDRYMLFSTEDFPICVKTGWREGNAILNEQLKALRPCGKFPLKQAILSAFYFVNLNRAQSGIDNYGHGRFPTYQESVVIITISDANAATELPSDFELRAEASSSTAGKNTVPGSEYTEEAFRWDQRLFSIVLRMSARAPAEGRVAPPTPVSPEAGVIQRICCATGGRTFAMHSHKQQSMVIDQLTQMCQVNGVVLRFEFPATGIMPRNGITENGDISEERKAEVAGENLRKALETRPMTFVLTRNRAPGHWPIPEAFWPESVQTSARLPSRKAHPMITVGITATDAMVNTEFPFDKYELDPTSPLAEYVRERSAALGNPNVCWQVYVTNSYRAPGLGKAFGYLKVATNGTSVNLFIMPYNYAVLLKLLEEQKMDVRLRSHPEWRRRLDQYVESCPSYYKQHLKKALLRLKLTGGLLDEPPQPLYPAPMLNALAKMKHLGKEEMETRCADIGMRLRQAPRAPTYTIPIEKREILVEKKNFRLEFEEERKAKMAARVEQEVKDKKRGSRSLPIPNQRRDSPVDDDLPPDPELPESNPEAIETISNHLLDLGTGALQDSVYRNPFNIPRSQLVQMIPRLRVNIEQQLSDSSIPALVGGLPGTQCKLQTAYELHSLPVGQMGNYDEYVKSLEAIGAAPLREVEHRAVREHAFGNPFKKDKKSLAVDEVGEAPAASRDNNNGMSKKDRRAMESNRPPRRKAGPLALNSMANWRERRRSTALSSVSDLSHTVEDLTDDLMDAEATVSDQTELDDALADFSLSPTTNGASSPTTSSTASRDSGVGEWGLDEEAEDEEEEDDDDEDILVIEEEGEEEGPPPAKKMKKEERRESEKKDKNLILDIDMDTSKRKSINNVIKSGKEEPNIDRIRRMKGEVCSIVRLFKSDDVIISKLESMFDSLAVFPNVVMTRFARDESMRFKKRTLSMTLQKRLDKLESSMNGSI